MTAAALALWLALSGAPASAPAAAPAQGAPRPPPGAPQAGARRAGSPPPPFIWSIPEVLDDVPVGQTLAAGDRPMRLRAVRSKWDAVRLRKKLGEDFLRAGLFIPPPSHLPQTLPLPFVAAVDGRRMMSYSAFFQVNGDGTTTLILGEVDLEARVNLEVPAPVFPGALDVAVSDVEAMRTVSFRAKAAAPEVLAYYRDVLGRAGFTDAGGGSFDRGGEHLAVMTSPGDDGFLRVMVLLRTEGAGARRPAGP